MTPQEELSVIQYRIAEIRKTCWCGSCVRLRGGGQHHNGPCGIDQERDYEPDGSSRNACLRMRERELAAKLKPAPPAADGEEAVS